MHHLLASLRKSRHALAVPLDRPTKGVSQWTGFKGVGAILKKKRWEIVRPLPFAPAKGETRIYASEGTPVKKDDRGRIMSLARETKASTKMAGRQGALTACDIVVLETMLFKLWDHLTGRCVPSIATIARWSGVSERTVQRGLKRLRAAGLLSWLARVKIIAGRAVQTSNRYFIGITGCQNGLQLPGNFNILLNQSGSGLFAAVRAAAVSLNLSVSMLDDYKIAVTSQI